MPVESDPGLWKQITGWLWAVLLPFLYGVYRKAEGAVSKTEFSDYKKNVRDDFKGVFEKIDANKDKVNERMDQLREGIEAKIDDLRRDVNGGFNAIRDELRQMHK